MVSYLHGGPTSRGDTIAVALVGFLLPLPLVTQSPSDDELREAAEKEMLARQYRVTGCGR